MVGNESVLLFLFITETALPIMFVVPSPVVIHYAGNNKTVLVECGIFCRPVTFTDCGRDMVYLLKAIVGTFRGLKKKHIALLQVKSKEYDGLLTEQQVTMKKKLLRLISGAILGK